MRRAYLLSMRVLGALARHPCSTLDVLIDIGEDDNQRSKVDVTLRRLLAQGLVSRRRGSSRTTMKGTRSEQWVYSLTKAGWSMVDGLRHAVRR